MMLVVSLSFVGFFFLAGGGQLSLVATRLCLVVVAVVFTVQKSGSAPLAEWARHAALEHDALKGCQAAQHASSHQTQSGDPSGERA